jgi:hypothetical protein
MSTAIAVPTWFGRLRIEIDTARVHFAYYEDRTAEPDWEDVDEDVPTALRLQADLHELECARDYEWYVYREGDRWHAMASLDQYALDDEAPSGYGSHPVTAIATALEGAT